MQDVLNVVRNSLNHRMLEPAHFYTFDNGAKTLYLERWETPDIAANLFVRQLSTEKMEEQVITAAHAEFRRNETGVIVALRNGSVQTRSLAAGGGDVRLSAFDEYALVLPMQGSGSLPQRTWRGVYELPPGDFVRQLTAARADPRLLAEWTAEARCGSGCRYWPWAIRCSRWRLALTFGNVTGRRGAGGQFVIIAIPAVHIAFLVLLQTLLRADARFIVVLAVLALIEILASAFMISRLN